MTNPTVARYWVYKDNTSNSRIPGHEAQYVLASDYGLLAAQLAEIQQERRNWLDTDTTARTLVSLQRDLNAERAKVAVLQSQLGQYGNHTMLCDMRDYSYELYDEPPEPTCTCGFDAALAQTDSAKKDENHAG